MSVLRLFAIFSLLTALIISGARPSHALEQVSSPSTDQAPQLSLKLLGHYPPIISKGIGLSSVENKVVWTPFIKSQSFSPDLSLTSVKRYQNSFKLLAGGSFNYKGIVYGYLGAAWNKKQNNTTLALAETANLSLESNISWMPTDKTKLSFDISHENVKETPLIAGFLQTETGLTYEHSLSDNLYLKVMGSYNSEDFNNSPRIDNTLDTGLGFHYTLTPTLQFGGEYHFTARDSTLNALDMEDNVLMLRTQMTW